MSDIYEEIIDGETHLRCAPGAIHEAICDRLHTQVAVCVAALTSTRLLPPRTIVQISAGSLVRPDLALVTAATGKLWLAAEIINSDDHRVDTVTKKLIYEELNIPRLWMVDPRYNNVEIYHGSPYGLTLKTILAGREALTESLLPDFQIVMDQLFLR
jgi:Uma2 family endonuclease